MQHHHWALIALLLAACAPPEFHFPAVDEAQCATVEHALYTNEDPAYCSRVTGVDGAVVKYLEDNGCDAWTECLILAPGETAVHGAPLASRGLISAVEFACDEVPPCP